MLYHGIILVNNDLPIDATSRCVYYVLTTISNEDTFLHVLVSIYGKTFQDNYYFNSLYMISIFHNFKKA